MSDSYIKLEEVNKGLHGVINLCQDPHGSSIFIMKTYSYSILNNRIGIKREIDLLARSRHPNIISMLDIQVSKENVAIILPRGKMDLREAINTLPRPDMETRRRYINDVLRGFKFLDDNGIMHCDIKHNNILLTEEDTLAFIDFGNAIQGVDKDYNLKFDTFINPIFSLPPEFINCLTYRTSGVKKRWLPRRPACLNKDNVRSAQYYAIGIILLTIYTWKLEAHAALIDRCLEIAFAAHAERSKMINFEMDETDEKITSMIAGYLDADSKTRMTSVNCDKLIGRLIIPKIEEIDRPEFKEVFKEIINFGIRIKLTVLELDIVLSYARATFVFCLDYTESETIRTSLSIASSVIVPCLAHGFNLNKICNLLSLNIDFTYEYIINLYRETRGIHTYNRVTMYTDNAVSAILGFKYYLNTSLPIEHYLKDIDSAVVPLSERVSNLRKYIQ